MNQEAGEPQSVARSPIAARLCSEHPRPRHQELPAIGPPPSKSQADCRPEPYPYSNRPNLTASTCPFCSSRLPSCRTCRWQNSRGAWPAETLPGERRQYAHLDAYWFDYTRVLFVWSRGRHVSDRSSSSLQYTARSQWPASDYNPLRLWKSARYALTPTFAATDMHGPSRRSSQLRFWQRERLLFFTSSPRMARKSFIMKKLASVYEPQYA